VRQPKKDKKKPITKFVVRERRFVGGPGSECNLIEVQLRLIRGTENGRQRRQKAAGSE
jgi:hypothetical protein